MRLKRRLFLTLGAGWAILAQVQGAFSAVIGSSGAVLYPLTALGPYLDTLIPRDESPSATDLNLDHRFIDHGHRNGRYMRLLRIGCKWLDAEAQRLGGSGFADLDPTSQEAIVTKAAAAPKGSLPHVFFKLTRRNAMRSYYANPETWDSLGYSGPPQPDGYLDHTEAPR